MWIEACPLICFPINNVAKKGKTNIWYTAYYQKVRENHILTRSRRIIVWQFNIKRNIAKSHIPWKTINVHVLIIHHPVYHWIRSLEKMNLWSESRTHFHENRWLTYVNFMYFVRKCFLYSYPYKSRHQYSFWQYCFLSGWGQKQRWHGHCLTSYKQVLEINRVLFGGLYTTCGD